MERLYGMGKNNNKNVKVVPQAKQTNKRGDDETGGPRNIDDLSDDDDDEDQDGDDDGEPAQK